MKGVLQIITMCVVVLGILLTWTFPAQATIIQLGLLATGEQLGEVARAAYDWAGKNYTSTILIADGAGNFKNSSGNNRPLDTFAVLWWHYSETQSLPGVFLEEKTKQAIKDYVESGGGLFLTALTLHYTFDLKVETGAKPRVFSPLGRDRPEIGVLPTDEGKHHPIFDGLDTSNPIFLCSMAQDGFTSDFMPVPDNLQGKLLATKTRGGGAGEGERPLVEFDIGQGKIITLGHHNAVYTDTKSEESKNLRKLTANIIEYLAANSAFLSVDSRGKLATTWSTIKWVLK